MQSPHLELFYFPECPYCQLVMDTIDELGILVDMNNIRQDSKHLQRLTQDTGRRTVPCLYIDNHPMHESRDIIAWLEKNRDKLKTRS